MHAAETMERPVISSSVDWPKLLMGVVLLVCFKITCQQNDLAR